MSKASSYAKFLSLLSNIKKECPDPEFEGCDEVLAYISIMESSGTPAKITNLAQSLQFGTGPTVQRKINLLEERGLIEVAPSKADGRAKLLSVSAKGNQHLKARSALLKLSLEG